MTMFNVLKPENSSLIWTKKILMKTRISKNKRILQERIIFIEIVQLIFYRELEIEFLDSLRSLPLIYRT